MIAIDALISVCDECDQDFGLRARRSRHRTGDALALLIGAIAFPGRLPAKAFVEQLLKSVAFEDLGARVDSLRVGNHPLAILSLQERSSDLTRPDDEVPQAIKLLNEDVHLSRP